MSDNPTAPEAEVPETVTPTENAGPAEGTLEWFKADAEKWKKLSRENEKKAKENFTAKQKLDKLEEASKTDLEKAQARIAELEETLTKTEREKLVSKLQAKYGFEDDDLDFLTATDEDGLTTQAEKLAKRLGNAAKPRAPKPDPTQGGGKQPIALNDFDALTKTLLGKVGGAKN